MSYLTTNHVPDAELLDPIARGEGVFRFRSAPVKKEDNTCPECNGEKIIRGFSNCCGAKPKGNGDCDSSDFGICSECGEHCDYEYPCDACDGKGIIL